jgi:hypothetical protein
VEDVDVTLRHNGATIHVSCNNFKAGIEGHEAPCGLRVGQIVHCQSFPDRMSFDAGGYDLICGNDRKNGKLQTSDKNELLTIESSEQGFLLTHAEPFTHHYEGNPCGTWNKETCDELEMRYIFRDAHTQILAHCQSWDDRNACGNLQVGTVYHCHLEAADKFSQSLSCIGAGSMGVDSSDLLVGNKGAAVR